MNSGTHVHADHRSAAGYLKKKLGGALGIGSNVRQVQRILGNLFNDKPAMPPGAGFDHLFEDGENSSRRYPRCESALYSGSYAGRHELLAGRRRVRRGHALHAGLWNGVMRFPGRRCPDALSFHAAASGIAAANRLFMCHDYAPGGRAYAFEITVAEERAKRPCP